MQHRNAPRAADGFRRDEAACARHNVQAREHLRAEISKPRQAKNVATERAIETYLGLLADLDATALTVAVERAQRSSNEALQAACALELTRRAR